ncbi:MAG TPA: zinc ABC transporter substrate-binding protein, partial [Propionibacteriaceae bacterium]|nr:zinc ABC transporter substrate-binding protein [Propionibacteriaceae bacterium]
MKPRALLALTLAAVGVFAAGCTSGGASSASPSGQAPVAIATTSVLGGVLSDITTCAGTTSTSLMKPGDDAHTYALSSEQVAQLTKAKLVVANGLGFEEGMTKTLANAKTDGANILEVAPLLDPQPLDATQASALDPHVFLDPSRMAKAADLIGAALTKATGDSKYTDCGTKVSASYTDLDAKVTEIMAVVPADKRKLVTDHESFGYFASHFHFTVIGVAIPGGSTDAETSSAQLATLVATVKSSGVRTIFASSSVNPKAIQALATEVGTVKVSTLYAESLGAPGSGADTYAGMMTTNAT